MPTAWPQVSVQLAVYREHRVLADLIGSILALDYPTEAIRVVVLDDSVGDDALLTRAVVESFAATRRVVYANRGSRQGFKAGALNYGLTLANCDLVAYFDADSRPLPAFLRETIPHFADPTIAAVQGRFSYANANVSPLTQLQSAVFDWLFAFEFPARARLGQSVFYMGTAGVWRKSVIQALGGWREVPFTAEDIDLAYRAGIRGWQVVYHPKVVARAGAIEDILAFRAQQRRWAESLLQAGASNLAGALRAPWTALGKIFEVTVGFAHATGVVLLLAVSVSMSAVLLNVERTQAWVALQVGFLVTVLVSPVLCALVLALRELYAEDWRVRVSLLLRAAPYMIAQSTSFVFGLADVLLASGGEFVATPKGGEVGVVEGSHRRWLLKHIVPVLCEAVFGASLCVSAILVGLRYPETGPLEGLVGVVALFSAAESLHAIACSYSRIRQQPRQ